MRKDTCAGLGDDLRRQSIVIGMRVRDHDAANVFKRNAARAKLRAQRGKRRGIVRSRVDQRKVVALSQINVDRPNGEGGRKGQRVKII